MAEFFTIPYAEIPWGPQPEGYPVTGSARIFTPTSYRNQVRDALRQNTGSPETFLSVDQEQALATTIQDGLAAAALHDAYKDELEELVPSQVTEDIHDEYWNLLNKIEAGKEAEQTLVICNLRFSDYLARASMRLLPRGDKEAAEDDTRAGRRQRSLIQTDKYKAWIPQNFTDLSSPNGTLDDRTQVASMALIRAARAYKPGVLNDEGKLVTFRAFASPYVKTDITQYVRGGTPSSHEMPVHVSAGLQAQIRKMRRDPSGFTPRNIARLEMLDNLQNMLSLDELTFAGAANEEIGWNGEDPMLTAAEVIADETFSTVSRVLARLRVDQIDRALHSLDTEREAGVMRLRHGLTDGILYTQNQVGQIYNVTGAAISDLEPRIKVKLLQRSRARLLLPFYNTTEGGAAPLRAGDVIKTQRTLGHSSIREVVDTEPMREDLESWQAYPGEAWDEPMRKTPAELASDYEVTTALFRETLFTAAPYSFQKSFKETMGSAYPKGLVDQISKAFGPELTAGHIADFWNKDLENFVEHVADQLGSEADPDRITQLLFRLLAERSHDNSTVELRIPKKLDGRLGYVGAWLTRGRLRILGNVGDNAGFGMTGLAHLQIEGGARHYAGINMKGHARLEINGHAGDFAGFAMGGNASMVVRGNIGTYGGYHMDSKGALIEVTGTTGDKLGFAAYRGGIIVDDEIKFAK